MSMSNNLKPESLDYDRTTELNAFEESKAGVKGLVDSGTQNLPKIFIRPPDELADEQNCLQSDLQVSTIDLDGGDREQIISQVKSAAKEWGFFRVVNHGIPLDVLDGMLDGVKKFHEQDAEAKKQFYSRDIAQKVKYGSNIDLYRSRSANWRDTFTISLADDDHLHPHELPQICRDSTIKYINEVTKVGETLFEVLSEALGLEPDHLGGIAECATGGRTFVGHYYPACPEPDLTMGTSTHTDPTFLTILLQDHIGGLQVLHKNQYINIPPLPGSLVINIGDMLQIVSNDEFISPKHRVVANRVGPRISVACFFSGVASTGKIYGPIEELVSENNPPRYKEFTVMDYISKFFVRPVDHENGLDEFKLPRLE